MILEYEDRKNFLKQHSEIVETWYRSSFSSKENVGDLRSIVMNAHRLNNNKRMSRKDFGNFYIKSGEELEQLGIDKNDKKIYGFGRTMNYLLDLAHKFVESYNADEETNNISNDDGENAMFIAVFDNTYRYYLTMLNTLLNIKSKNKEHLIVFTDDEVFTALGVDIFEQDDLGRIINAYYIKNDYFKDDLLRQKHDLFMSIYGFQPQIVKVSISGFSSEI